MRLCSLGLVSLFVFAGCGLIQLKAPERSQAPRHEAGSAHFTLYTDVPLESAAAILEDFERSTQVLGELGLVLPRGRRLSVVLFEQPFDFRGILPESQHKLIDAFFTDDSNDVVARPTVVMHAESGYVTNAARATQTFQHELTHFLVRTNLGQTPLWLNEGLAQFHETVELDFASGELIVGRPPALELSHEWPPIEELQRAGWEQFRSPTRQHAFYAGAWALVHLLVTDARYHDGFVRFLAGIRGGSSWRDSWMASFPGLNAATLETDLRVHLSSGEPLAVRKKLDFAGSRKPEWADCRLRQIVAPRRAGTPAGTITRVLMFVSCVACLGDPGLPAVDRPG